MIWKRSKCYRYRYRLGKNTGVTRLFKNVSQNANYMTCVIRRANDPRDGNSGTGIWYTRRIRVWGWFFTCGWHPYPIWIETGMGRIFFSPTDNPTGIWYFTTAIILDCEQVKICSFYYINYDLFWLLNFATLYLKYLLNINFEHVHIVLYSLN
jgi:hypothetical protein